MEGKRLFLCAVWPKNIYVLYGAFLCINFGVKLEKSCRWACLEVGNKKQSQRISRVWKRKKFPRLSNLTSFWEASEGEGTIDTVNNLAITETLITTCCSLWRSTWNVSWWEWLKQQLGACLNRWFCCYINQPIEDEKIKPMIINQAAQRATCWIILLSIVQLGSYFLLLVHFAINGNNPEPHSNANLGVTAVLSAMSFQCHVAQLMSEPLGTSLHRYRHSNIWHFKCKTVKLCKASNCATSEENVWVNRSRHPDRVRLW